ncbi:MAG TPA: thiamine phosphate synthase [Micromonosporaceae bacterium]|nr:thiamine phosphate synthase [Micromonosporaceae bacterium]
MLGRLHLITDSRSGADPVAQVRTALSVATPELVIQFRPADSWPDRLVFEQASKIKTLTHASGVPLLVNDRIDIALAVGADGAHVGAEDLPVAVARRLLGPGKLLGATARDAATARLAVNDGASYVGVGPCYRSSTKDGLPSPLGPEGVAAVAPFAQVIAIGGVTLDTVPALMAAAAHGVAVIAAVADAPDPAAALAALLKAVAR